MRTAREDSFITDPLETILGNKSAYWVLLFIYHYGEIYPSQIAKALNLNLTPLLDQCRRFSDAGILTRKVFGKSTVYALNIKSPVYQSLYRLIGDSYKAIPENEKEQIFKIRTRSRKAGKEVIND
jgi:hypothetical protein